MTDDLLRPSEAATLLGITEATLSKWRNKRRYKLPFVKIGARVSYRRSDLEKFLQTRTVGGTEAVPENFGAADLKNGRKINPSRRGRKARKA